MGALADASAAYVQPLLDLTDGSQEQLEKAFIFGQFCWNLALMPEESREGAIEGIKPAFHLDDDGLEELRRTVIEPMIQRHHDMFPQMHEQRVAGALMGMPPPDEETPAPAPLRGEDTYPGTPRNAPCPCGSGKKYKRCCGRVA